MTHNETLNALLKLGHVRADITLDPSMFIGADSNPLAVLALQCSGEGGASMDELAALTGLSVEVFDRDKPMPDLGEGIILQALGKLVLVWFAVYRNELAEAAGLVGREALPGIVPAALAGALQGFADAPVRVLSLGVAA